MEIHDQLHLRHFNIDDAHAVSFTVNTTLSNEVIYKKNYTPFINKYYHLNVIKTFSFKITYYLTAIWTHISEPLAHGLNTRTILRTILHKIMNLNVNSPSVTTEEEHD